MSDVLIVSMQMADGTRIDFPCECPLCDSVDVTVTKLDAHRLEIACHACGLTPTTDFRHASLLG